MYKKLLKALVMVGLVALTFGSLPALAEDDGLSVSADVGVYSSYVFRGYALSYESIVVQPSVTLGYDGYGLDGFSLKVWGNFDTDYSDELPARDDYNETDFTLSYDWEYDIIDFSVGYIYYDTDVGDTQEIYFKASIEGYLNPSITFYRDIDATDGMYVNLGFEHTYAITSAIDLDVSATIGYYDLPDDGPHVGYHGLHDGTISASSTFNITDNLSMTPSLKYIWALQPDASTELGNANIHGNTDQFVGGFTCSYSF